MSSRYLHLTGLMGIMLFLCSCAGSLRPLHTQPAVSGGIKAKNQMALKDLPKPNNKVVAAVYRFRDETGQYKPSENSISYSTAVTQGATSILIKAMESSGWFQPIEREGISNLLNERRIIQKTRQQNNDRTKLKPLLFAGVILEGGIIGYDSNVITGGAGVRYFGTDVSGQFRKDRVTIYLRAVSTQTGRILKSVRTTKSIISQKLSGGLFRYIDANRLLESEVGITMNEPPTIAVTEAINESVKRLIIQGVNEKLWRPKNKLAFSIYKKKHKLAANEVKRKTNLDYYGLVNKTSLRKGFSITGDYSFGSYIGSYSNETQNSGIMVQLEKYFNDDLPFSIKLNYQRSQIGAQQVFSMPTNNIDLLLDGYLLPRRPLSPYASVGGGVLFYDHKLPGTNMQEFPSFSGEVGLDYQFEHSLGIRMGISYRYMLQDGIDGVSVGSINDQQWSVLTGITVRI